MLSADDAASFERCMAVGGLAVFPADTVYGLACDPESPAAVRSLYALKRRPPDRSAAVMFFSLDRALTALPELGPRVRAALETLLPGAVTLLVDNRAGRFALACGGDAGTLGLRVPALPPVAEALSRVSRPVIQTSANRSGGPDARTLGEVPAELREAADLVLDGGPLPGTPSTVVDLRAFEREGVWSIVRAGAVTEDRVETALRAL